MSKYQEVLDQAERFRTMFGALLGLTDKLKELGSLEDAAVNAEDRAKAAKEEARLAKEDAGVAWADYQAKVDEDAAKRAEADAKAAEAAAQERAKVEAEAVAKLADMHGLVSTERSILVKLQGDVKSTRAQLESTNEDLANAITAKEEVEKQIAALRAKLS